MGNIFRGAIVRERGYLKTHSLGNHHSPIMVPVAVAVLMVNVVEVVLEKVWKGI